MLTWLVQIPSVVPEGADGAASNGRSSAGAQLGISAGLLSSVL